MTAKEMYRAYDISLATATLGKWEHLVREITYGEKTEPTVRIVYTSLIKAQAEGVLDYLRQQERRS